MLERLEHEAPFDCVFVHGAGETNVLWRRTIQGLSGGKRALAVNLPGHPDGEITCKTIDEYTEAVHAFVSDSRLGRVAVCGHSMGGAITLTLALRHPEDVAGLILVGTGAKMGVLPEIVSGLRDQPLKVIEQTITPMNYFKVDLETAREARAAMSLSNPAIFLNDYLACVGFDVRERLREIPFRTLIICGESDRTTPPKWAHYLNANILSSTAYFVRDAGHMVPLEKPVLCGSLMQSFLSELTR